MSDVFILLTTEQM